MHNNLRAEIARLGKKEFEFAQEIEMNTRTFQRKLSGISDFTCSEMKKIRGAFNGKFTLDYLFLQGEQSA